MNKRKVDESIREAINIDDLFEALSGAWRIANAGAKRKFIFGLKIGKISNCKCLSCFEYYNEFEKIRIRYEMYDYNSAVKYI